jgi:hypothetical protein
MAAWRSTTERRLSCVCCVISACGNLQALGIPKRTSRRVGPGLPRFVETLLSEHLTAKGYLRKVGEHGIPVSQLNSENDG